MKAAVVAADSKKLVIKASHKAAVADGFATAFFLNTKKAHTWYVFTLRSWFPQRISFNI